jgi:hypothetical protein
MRQLQQNIRGVISNLQALGEVEDGRAELANTKARRLTWQSAT